RGISERRMSSLRSWTQKDRADGAVHILADVAARRFAAPGPRRVRYRTSFAVTVADGWTARKGEGRYATSRRIEAIAPAAMTTPKSTRIPRSRSTTASP